MGMQMAKGSQVSPACILTQSDQNRSTHYAWPLWNLQEKVKL